MISKTGNYFEILKLSFPRKRESNNGFTLVEMLVVLAIIVMLLGVSMPFVSGFGKGLRLKTTARAILGTLRIAKSNAITQRKKYSVLFNAESGEYWIQDTDGRIFERKYRLPGSVRFALSAEEDDPITFDNDSVTFLATGAVDGQSGSVTITDASGKSKTISVAGTTGRIDID